MNRLLFTVAFTLTTVSGCTTFNNGDTSSPFTNPTPGSRLELRVTIPLPAESYTVYFQSGGKGLSGFNRFEPHCQLHAKGVSDGSLVLQPRSYEIDRVTYKTPIYVRNTPIQLTASEGFRLQVADRDDGPSDVIEVVEMTFKQTPDSQALGLTCGGGQDVPSEALPPSIEEIRMALGAHARLVLKGDD